MKGNALREIEILDRQIRIGYQNRNKYKTTGFLGKINAEKPSRATRRAKGNWL